MRIDMDSLLADRQDVTGSIDADAPEDSRVDLVAPGLGRHDTDASVGKATAVVVDLDTGGVVEAEIGVHFGTDHVDDVGLALLQPDGVRLVRLEFLHRIVGHQPACLIKYYLAGGNAALEPVAEILGA